VRDVSEAEALEIALIENLQREDLNPIERAQAYRRYLDAFRATPESLADRIGESRANVTNYLRLLTLPKVVQDMIVNGDLSMGQARAIAGIQNPDRQREVATIAARKNLSVREVERLARRLDDGLDLRPRRPGTGRLDPHLADVQERLSRALGLRVKLFAGRKKNSGRVVIRYESLEEFDRIAERLLGATSLD